MNLFDFVPTCVLETVVDTLEPFCSDDKPARPSTPRRVRTVEEMIEEYRHDREIEEQIKRELREKEEKARARREHLASLPWYKRLWEIFIHGEDGK